MSSHVHVAWCRLLFRSLAACAADPEEFGCRLPANVLVRVSCTRQQYCWIGFFGGVCSFSRIRSCVECCLPSSHIKCTCIFRCQLKPSDSQVMMLISDLQWCFLHLGFDGFGFHRGYQNMSKMKSNRGSNNSKFMDSGFACLACLHSSRLCLSFKMFVSTCTSKNQKAH